MEEIIMKKILQKVNIGHYIGGLYLKGGSWCEYDTNMELVKVYTEPKPMYCERSNKVTWKECVILTFDEKGRSIEGLETFGNIPSIICEDFDKAIEKKKYIVVD